MFYYIELVCRWIFSLQMIFWGLNGFFNWINIPPSGEGVGKFVQACIDTRFIMPTVKILEIVSGILLLCSFLVILNIFIFAPIVFGITMLHVLHNPKPWGVVLPIAVPFAIILGLNFHSLFR
ncbi:MAG TPA: hypothetical protein VF412_14940 [Bdellovibrio sp.]|uniref:hypothetical protein n=1 Tax=Bdellovibrio sp. TaxID=28201 RepID=UPI002EEEFA8C